MAEEAPMERTLALIKPDAAGRPGAAAKIMQLIEQAGFTIVAKRQLKLSKERAQEFYGEHAGKPFFEGLVEFMTSGPIWALCLSKPDAIKAWRALMGPTNTLVAKEQAPESLRALFGTDGTRNATHGSDAPASAAREIAFYFEAVPGKPDALQAPVERTFAMIKPDATGRPGAAEEIMQLIEQAGFKIVAKQHTQLSKERAEQFYGEHAGKPFFPGLVSFMTSGPIWALVLERPGAIYEWRALMGPTNTLVARKEAPHSLRALFGTDGTRNATHGSDSPESAAREIAFHFDAVPGQPGALMAPMERTFAMIKPDATGRPGDAREIMQLIELAGFKIVAKQQTQLTKSKAEQFYGEHAGKPFFAGLVSFMTSGPIWALVLAKPGAILAWRALMGPTNTLVAKKSAPKSLRALYGTDGTRNATHGSDSPASAAREIKFFFPNLVLDNLIPQDEEAAASAIDAKLGSIMVQALTHIAKTKAASTERDALALLGKYLLENNPNKAKVYLPGQDVPDAPNATADGEWALAEAEKRHENLKSFLRSYPSASSLLALDPETAAVAPGPGSEKPSEWAHQDAVYLRPGAKIVA